MEHCAAGPLVRCHSNGCQNLYIIILCETKLSLAYNILLIFLFTLVSNYLPTYSTFFFLIIVVKTSVEADDRNPSKLRATMMIPRPDSIMSLTGAGYCKFHNGLEFQKECKKWSFSK